MAKTECPVNLWPADRQKPRSLSGLELIHCEAQPEPSTCHMHNSVNILGLVVLH